MQTEPLSPRLQLLLLTVDKQEVAALHHTEDPVGFVRFCGQHWTNAKGDSTMISQQVLPQ